MSFLVTNCFHWIGFHMVDYLLEQGHNVVGLDDLTTSKKENLSMFVGRNDLFEFNANNREGLNEKYDTTFIIGNGTVKQDVESERTIRLCYNTKVGKINTDTTIIKLPLLFGEWMEMNEEGLYHQNNFIRFDSDYFLTEAVYIGDFIKCVMHALKSTQLPAYVEVKSSDNNETKEENLEKSIYVRDNKPIDEKVKLVIDHYQKFKNFY